MRWLLAQKAANAESKGKTQLNSKTITLDHWEREYGCDLMRSGLKPEFRDEIITYGELVQAAYDNLGQDQGRPEQWGNATKAPEDFLTYLGDNYGLAVPPAQPGSNGNPGGLPSSTCDRYELPAVRSDGLSPLFEGLPGKGAGENPDPNRPMGVKHLKRLTKANQGPPGDWQSQDTLWTKLCKYVPALLVNAAGGNRALFGADEQKRKPRGTFFGYVALSKPKQSAGAPSHKQTEVVSNKSAAAADGDATEELPGLDVALVWRGTIFKEEWESNFCENQLDVWDVNQWDYKIVPKADQVGVHAGFCDLYTRPVENPKIAQRAQQGEAGPSPRTVVQEWLKLLMKDYKIKTITATGHSLGGGLATLCAYDVALFLEEEWKKGFNDPKFSKWETKKPPTVRMVTFAAPRAGNAAFVEHFNSLGIEALRVVNNGDYVPLVPGLQTQGVAWFLENFTTSFRGAAQVDTTHPAVVKARQRCRDYCRHRDDFPQDRENPQVAPPLADTAFMRWLKAPSLWLNALAADVKRWVKGPSWLHVWGFFHVGQALKLNAAWVKVGPKGWPQQPGGWRARFLKDVRFPDTHNLELHLYIISLLQPNGPPCGRDAGAEVTRNPLLLNKSADILAGNTCPKEWWADTHGRRLDGDGCWVLAPQPALAAAAVEAQAGVAAAEPTAAPIAGFGVAGVPAAAGADNTAGNDIQQPPDQQSATAAATVTSSDADGKPAVNSNTAITVDCRDAIATA